MKLPLREVKAIISIGLVSTWPAMAFGISPEFIKHLEDEAQQGDAKAQLMLAHQYSKGTALERNEKKAFEWTQKAANSGDLEAKYYLCRRYKDGDGVEINYFEARNWCLLAAKEGNYSAQNLLGTLYEEGLGVSKNYKTAIFWYRKAASSRVNFTLSRLAGMYEHGKGVGKSKVISYALYNYAARGADPFFSNLPRTQRDALARSMTSEEIDAAQELSSKFEKSQDLLNTLDIESKRINNQKNG